MIEIIDEWVLLTMTIKISNYDGVYAYHTYLFGNLNHFLATACIKKAD